MNKSKNVLFNNILFIMIIAGCFSSLLTVPLGIHEGRKIFYICSYLSILGILKNFIIEKERIPLKNIIVSLSILTFGLVNIIWVITNKSTDHNQFNLIHSTLLQTGKMLISASFLYLYFSKIKIKNTLTIRLVAILITLTISTYAYYQYYISTESRVELGIGVATTAAYIISISSSLMLSIILTLETKYKYYLASFAFIYSFIAIIVTQTRAAIIIFPIITIIIFYYYTPKKNILKVTGLMIIMLLVTGFIFKSTLIMRYEQATQDISLYNESNSNTSLGARFAMANIGIKTGMQAPLGQSATSRAQKMEDFININSNLSGAKIFSHTHLHNEFIDTFSLRGIFGLLSLLFLYISLLFTSLYKKFNIGLFTVIFSSIIYGISDVILFNKETLLVVFLCIFISLLIGPNNFNYTFSQRQVE